MEPSTGWSSTMMNDDEDPIKKLKNVQGWCFPIMIAILDMIFANHNLEDDILHILELV